MKRTKIVSLFFFLLAFTTLQAQVLHDISTRNLNIAGSDTQDYIITGYTTTNYVEVQPGYKGKITLFNLTMDLSSYMSPITFHGETDRSNLDPISNVDIILEGVNHLTYSGSFGAAVIQVDQGTQINISAIDPSDNASGTLSAIQTSTGGGAGIGARQSGAEYQAIGNAQTNCSSGTMQTAGGNIVISSGTITAKGGHGAGIGGGFLTFYDGIIVIYGGIVNATAIYDAAGVGSGCPQGTGIINCYTPNSTIVALPPAVVTAQGAGDSPNGGVGYDLFPELGLAGTSNILYIGDPAKPLVTVHTEDYEPNANVYVDLSQNDIVANIVATIIPSDRLDINQIKFGTTDHAGIYQFNGILQSSTTFFTDASSSNPATFGRPYLPEEVILNSGGEVILDLLKTNLSIQPFAATPLQEGYTPFQADSAAYTVKITYNDPLPMTNVVFDLANGNRSDFDNITFLAEDSITPITAPTSFQDGDIYYIKVPLKPDKLIGEYSDVLRIIGNWNGSSTGYIRLVAHQLVTKLIYANICQGESYFFNGEYLTDAGIYVGNFIDSEGKDSIVALQLQYHPSYNITTDVTICDNELPYTWYNETFAIGTTSGTYPFHYTTVNGCDSTVTVNLTVNATYTITETYAICQSELPYTWRDTIFEVGTESDIYTFHRSTIHGCDSIVTLNLTIYPTYNLTIAKTICENQLPFTWRDTIFEVGTTTGLYQFYRTSVHGCDSIVTLDLIVNDSSLVYLYDTVFADSTYNAYNFHYTASQTIETVELRQNLTNAIGCDSTVILHLSVVKPPFVTILNDMPQICADQRTFDISYTYSDSTRIIPTLIEILFDEETLAAGFRNISTTATLDDITIPLPTNVVPNIYRGTLHASITDFEQDINFEFTVNYPSSIIEQHWNDVLALRNETLNGGYVFDEYQWYKNGEAIVGETSSYLYVGPDEELDLEAEYSVVVRRIGEDNRITTCTITPTYHIDIQDYPTLVGRSTPLTLPIKQTSELYIYDTNGLLILAKTLTPNNATIITPNASGTYIIQIINSQAGTMTYKMIVQ